MVGRSGRSCGSPSKNRSRAMRTRWMARSRAVARAGRAWCQPTIALWRARITAARMAGPERRRPSTKRRLAVGGGRSSPNSNAAARTARRTCNRCGRGSLPVGSRSAKLIGAIAGSATSGGALSKKSRSRSVQLASGLSLRLATVSFVLSPEAFRRLKLKLFSPSRTLRWFGLLMAEVDGKPRGGPRGRINSTYGCGSHLDGWHSSLRHRLRRAATVIPGARGAPTDDSSAPERSPPRHPARDEPWRRERLHPPASSA